MENNFNFELFKSQKSKFNVTVALTKPGALSLSSGMYHKHKLVDYRGVQLLLDKSKNAVAIKFLEDETGEGVFKLKSREDGKGGFISAKSFVDCYGLERYLGSRYTPEVVNDPNYGTIFVIYLDNAQ